MIRVIVCGYNCDKTLPKCVESISMQTNKDYSVLESIDTDSNRRYLLKNTIDCANSFKRDDDILVFVDADDYLIDEDAFNVIADAYKEDPFLLLTYGSYVTLSNHKRGKFCGPYKDGEDFRNSEWRGSHLKTMKVKLWKQIPYDHFVDANNMVFRCCADRAIMIPAMELAGHRRIKYIETLVYGYNDTNPISVWNINRELSLKTRKEIAIKRKLPVWEQK